MIDETVGIELWHANMAHQKGNDAERDRHLRTALKHDSDLAHYPWCEESEFILKIARRLLADEKP